MKSILDDGFDVNASSDDKRRTALHLAADEDCPVAVDALVDVGADTTSIDIREICFFVEPPFTTTSNTCWPI